MGADGDAGTCTARIPQGEALQGSAADTKPDGGPAPRRGRDKHHDRGSRMTVADHCAELATLAPMLGPALYRDVTSTGTWARGFQSALSLYNPDVLQAK